jgi:hypothetical protein
MTGTVTSIEVPGTFCLITDPTGKVFFAHRDDFLEPATMVVGTDVECRLKSREPRAGSTRQRRM